MRAFNHSCQGESHKVDEKVCQDASRAEVIPEKGLTICIVSDGHGGEQYFRSQIGSQALVDITLEKVQDFCTGITKLGTLTGNPFTQIEITANKIGLDGNLVEIDTRFMQLFCAIKAEWMFRIFQDAMNEPLGEWELAHVKEPYLNQFREKRSLEKIYGATLMTFVRTPDFWFAFQLGDGKMIMFDRNGKGSEPVLWDKDCFLNKTTSICQEDATDRFRYTFQGDGEFPFAVFLGSDGIDDTFTDGEPLYDFYRGLIQGLSMNGDTAVQDYLRTNLPILSARGSRDDMSVAYCYDESLLNTAVTEMTRKQVETFQDEFKDLYIKANNEKEKVKEMEENNKEILQEVQESIDVIADLDIKIETLSQEVTEMEKKKRKLEDEMESKIQAIRDEYKDKFSEIDESIQDKGTELTDINNRRSKFNSPEYKAKKKLLIDLTYAKSDIEKTEKSLTSLVTKINRLQEFLGEDITPCEMLIELLIPKVDYTPQETQTEPSAQETVPATEEKVADAEEVVREDNPFKDDERPSNTEDKPGKGSPIAEKEETNEEDKTADEDKHIVKQSDDVVADIIPEGTRDAAETSNETPKEQ